MASHVIDLWPDDLRVSDETTPGLLLRQQAELLGERTKGRVEAEVVTQPIPNGRLRHHFRLRATALGGYMHTLFYAVHGKNQPYPVEIYPELADVGAGISSPILCQTQAELETALRDIFASAGTRNMIQSLLAA